MTTEKHAVVLGTISLLTALAAVKFQKASENPFDSRPATIAFIVTALLIYGFTAARARPITLDEKGHIIYYCYQQILNSLVLISEVVCKACLVSLFFNPNGPGWNVYVACATPCCFGVAVWAILCNFAPSCVEWLVPCMGPTGSSGGKEENHRVSESYGSPVCSSSVVSENQSNSQQDHSTQANGKTANTGNANSPHIIQFSPNKGTMSKAHPDPDEKPIQSPNPLKASEGQGLDTPSLSQMPFVWSRASYKPFDHPLDV